MLLFLFIEKIISFIRSHVLRFLTLTLLLSISSTTFPQEAIQISEETTILSKSIFDINHDKFTNHKVYFYGENHTYQYSDSVGFDIFKKVVRDNNVNVYCVERGTAFEYIFYYYLKYKTLKLKDNDGYKNLDVYPKYFTNHFLSPLANIFENHDSLIFRSFDIERDLTVALAVVHHILSNTENSIYFYNIKKKIQSIPLSKSKTYTLCRLLISMYKKNKDLFKQKLTVSEFYYTNKIIEGLGPGIIHDSLMSQNLVCEAFIQREVFMLKNMEEIINDNTCKNIYVRGGILHLLDKQELNKRYSCYDYTSYINYFTKTDYIKMYCIYPEDRKFDYNFWVLNHEKRVAIANELFFNLKQRCTIFDISKEKKFFDSSFDYLIYCH